jgi:hypothetical protein
MIINNLGYSQLVGTTTVFRPNPEEFFAAWRENNRINAFLLSCNSR